MNKPQIKKEILKASKLAGFSSIDFQISIPPKKEMGDFATNVAFLLAKRSGKDINKTAEKIAYKLAQSSKFKKVEVINGYINIFLKQSDQFAEIKKIIKSPNLYGLNQSLQNKKIHPVKSRSAGSARPTFNRVNVEFISANPTGPLTVGNSRGGVIGDVLSNILSISGAKVTREYYFNDAGGQIDILGHSIIGDKESQYQGDYIKKLNQKLKIKNQKPFEEKDFKQIGKLAAQILIKQIKKTCDKMGIKYDVWFAEGRDLRDKGKVEKIIKWLLDKNLAYKKDGAIWFKSKKFGDDKDRVIVRKTGEPTYFGVDCAYHKNKFVERKFDKVINIWGADHHGDVKRIKGFVKALGYEKSFEILLHQFVRIIKDGKEVRMSKRAGNYVLVDDLLNEVGRDVYRFFMLQYSMNSHMDFDLKLAKERSNKNPVFYVQYSYARIYGILAKLKTLPTGRQVKNLKFKINEGDLSLLDKSEEKELAKKILELPELISKIAENYQVHLLTKYAIELAKSFHNFYENCPILKANDELKNARLILLSATKIALKNVLDIMGISSPSQM